MQVTFLADKLSERSFLALKNSKNKNKFIRKAIEYYMSNNDIHDNSKNDIHKELSEIKYLIKELNKNRTIKTEGRSLENKLVSEEKKRDKEEKTSEVNNNKDSDFTDEQKREIERSIDNFNSNYLKGDFKNESIS